MYPCVAPMSHDRHGMYFVGLNLDEQKPSSVANENDTEGASANNLLQSAEI